MKKIFILLIGLLLINSGISFSQNNENKADDAARIAITPQVSDQEIPASAKKMLLNKMRQICTKNGLSGDSENSLFFMDASVDVLSKEITPTAPPMHALNLQINFYIKGADGNVYSETSYSTKGVGKNETKAYLQGLKNINTSRGQFKAFVEKGKTKIIEYYNSQCDFVISKANALYKQGNVNDAVKLLMSVPPVCKECYDLSMELVSEFKPQEEQNVQAPCSGDSIISKFDKDDEGWVVVGDAKEAFAKPDYKDGYIFATDEATGGVWYWSAPEKFLGDKSCFYGKKLSFSLKQSSTDNQFDDADIIIEGENIKIVYNTEKNPGTDWTNYSVTLSEKSGWLYNLEEPKQVSKEDFMSVLKNIKALYIRGEFVEGDDNGSLDNVRISE